MEAGSFPKHVNVHPDELVEIFEEGKSIADYVDGLEGHDERLKSALAHTLRQSTFQDACGKLFICMAAELSQNENRNLVEFLMRLLVEMAIISKPGIRKPASLFLWT
ncbi:hypothetical protein HAX54_012394, partial [Datura stramonium]|nr:hypothetical protein [Datura stramonium]